MHAARTLRPTAAALLVWVAALSPAARAEPAKPAQSTWDPARASSPDSVDELKALQARVRAVVDQATPATVGLLAGSGAGSGVIVSEDGLVLTAAHVIFDPRTEAVARRIVVILPDGRSVKAKGLGVNPEIDSGMLKITDPPPKDGDWPGAKDGKWPAAPVAKTMDLKKGHWVVSLGHPGGPKEHRPPPVRVGRFESFQKGETALRTDCVLVGGDSGGPLFDLTGRVVGIHSRIGTFLEYNMHVPTEAFQDEWARLTRGDVVGKTVKVELGLSLEEDADAPTVAKVVEDGPAAAAGLQVGDVILKFDGEKVLAADDLMQVLTGCEPGKTVAVEVQRGSKVVTVKLTPTKKKSRKS
jgi:serine protease Do